MRVWYRCLSVGNRRHLRTRRSRPLVPLGPEVDAIEVWHLFFFQAEDGIRDYKVTGVQTCALPIFPGHRPRAWPTDGTRDPAVPDRATDGRAPRLRRVGARGRLLLGSARLGGLSHGRLDRKSVV